MKNPIFLSIIIVTLGGVLGAFSQSSSENSSGYEAPNFRTGLISKLNLESWKPPVEEKKVWLDRSVEDRQVHIQHGRKVEIERCETKEVESLELLFKPDVDRDMDNLEARLENKEELPPGYIEPIQVGISASVYREGKKEFSKVKVTVGNESCTIWSSINFHHMQGVVEYMANGRRYYGGGGVSYYLQETASEAGCPVDATNFRGDRIGYVVIDSERSEKAFTAVDDIHDLYRVEKVHLMKAYDVRIKNMKLSNDWHKENPETPKDIKIQFWKREEGGSN